MDPKRKLKGMLARIFSDAVAEEHELKELETYLASNVLTPDDLREVIEDFIQTTWKITIADGVVTDREKARLQEIVHVLGLGKETVPEEWARLLDDPSEPGAPAAEAPEEPVS